VAAPVAIRRAPLEVSEQGYALALRGAADGMWEWNPLTKDLYLSPRLLAIFGYPESYVVSTTDEWMQLVHPDDRVFYNAENIRHLRRQTPYFQCEYRIRRADGEWAWGYSRGVAAFDADGVARRMAGSITDISARKHAEAELLRARQEVEALNTSLEQRVLDRTRELAVAIEALKSTHSSLDQAHQQLIQAERLASLGRMVAVIAHELNTPIGNCRIAASTLRDEAQVFAAKIESGLRRSELTTFMATLETGTELLDRSLQRAAGLISSFKQVAVDQTSAQRRRFELDELIDEIRTTVSPGLNRSGCKHQWQVVKGVSMDSFPGHLGQVLINLVDNAVMHAFEGRRPGTIVVVASEHGPDDICLEVRDDGVGVPEDKQHQVFEPFFTTRMGRGGTGLGLSIAYNIVSGVLGGSLALQSTPGEGSVFRLLIPKNAPLRSESAGLPETGLKLEY
jgi:PAS domain S-box-containing protein